MEIKHWFIQLFIAIDQLLNILITPFSSGAWADETLSSRSYRMYMKNKFWGRVTMPVIDWLFKWQKLPVGAIGHCHSAYMREKERYNLPVEIRTIENKGSK